MLFSIYFLKGQSDAPGCHFIHFVHKMGDVFGQAYKTFSTNYGPRESASPIIKREILREVYNVK